MPNETTYPAPRALFAGDSTSFIINDADFPSSDGWSLQYVISAPTPVLVTATVIPEGHNVALTTDITTGIAPKVYATCLLFSKGGERKSVQAPNLFVLPNPAAGITPTWAMQSLTDCQTALANIGKATYSSVTVNGETYTKSDISKLMAFRDRLVGIVDAELAAMGRPTIGGRKKTIVTRFVS